MHHWTQARIDTMLSRLILTLLFILVLLGGGIAMGYAQEATETPTDEPTVEIFTETPTEAATEVPTDEPTQTPFVVTEVVTATPEEATPEPPTETPLPTDTLAPTETPPPTETTIPTDTPEPTETPLPTALPTPTPMPPVEPPEDDPPAPDTGSAILLVFLSVLATVLTVFGGTITFYAVRFLKNLPPVAQDFVRSNEGWIRQQADAHLDELDRRAAATTHTTLDDDQAKAVRKEVEAALNEFFARPETASMIASQSASGRMPDAPPGMQWILSPATPTDESPAG